MILRPEHSTRVLSPAANSNTHFNALAKIERRIGLSDFANRQLIMCVVGVIPFGMHQSLPILAAQSSPVRQQPRCESHFLLYHA